MQSLAPMKKYPTKYFHFSKQGKDNDDPARLKLAADALNAHISYTDHGDSITGVLVLPRPAFGVFLPGYYVRAYKGIHDLIGPVSIGNHPMESVRKQLF